MGNATPHHGSAELIDAAPHAHLLSNGRYRVLVTAAGSGYSAFEGYALTRWTPDRTRDADGSFFYVRDLESGAYWSAGHQPVQRPAHRYEVRYAPGCVAITREDERVETLTEMCVSPNDDVELRRYTLTNRGDRARHLELTTYAEVVLNSPAADAGHPAFSKLFVQTEYMPREQALLAKRRPRSPEDETIWLAYLLRGEPPSDDTGTLQYETDRARFLGRGRTTANPQALQAAAQLSGTVGNVLDPVVCMRRTVQLKPGETARFVSVLGAGHSRQSAEKVIARQGATRELDETFEGAGSRARKLAADVALSDEWVARLPTLTGALAYGHPALRAPQEILRRNSRAASALRVHGLSGDLPLVVFRVARAQELTTLEAVAKVVAYWRLEGLPVELLVLSDDASGASDLERAASEIVAALPQGRAIARGGAFVRRADQMPAEDQLLAQSVARIVVRGELPDLRVGAATYSRRAGPAVVRQASHPAVAANRAARGTFPGEEEPLLLFNGYGGFTQDGSEYVIHLWRDSSGLRRPPLPWINVVANEELGFLATDSGAGYTWSVNSRVNRLTPWFNDPVSDPHGEALYIRDEEMHVFWSPTPGPALGPAGYEVRHGFGYTRYRHTSLELEQNVLQFVPRHDPVKIVQLRVTNRSARTRLLSVFWYAQLVLGELAHESGRFVITRHDAESGALLAASRHDDEFAHRIAFAAAVTPEGSERRTTVTADRTAFLGRYGSTESPSALRSGLPLDGRTGAGLDPCAAFHVPMELGQGETVRCAFLLGQAESESAARALIARYRSTGAIDQALDDVSAFWRDTLSRVRVETPLPAIDLMVNGWLSYQNLSCRVWGRSAFYQSGGAFGFRDQLQDAAALVYLLPGLTRRQILLHAAHQFVEGDVLHWWHPRLSKGLRTRFSDDLLWLPYVTMFYVQKTGDASVLDEEVRFLTARALEPGEDEVYLVPQDSGERASVYEHCCRALDRSLTEGPHGLPLMGTGDWNDGMNRVGREGRGESVWLGFFLYDILESFTSECDRRGDPARTERYRSYQARLATALNDAGWDGAWYRRAYYDNGAPLGSAQNDECRIDAIAQAWAVLSGVAPPERAARAMHALEEHLVSEKEGLIRLLTPAFDKTPHDPGYIKGYLPGVRENGGQYTHGALWAVRALAELGRADRAARLLEMLSPVSHARTPEEVAVYQVEPYVIAADVYGVAPHVGRGGWTWYTGSAGWMFRVALESILGVDIVGGHTLLLRPCIPSSWPGFTLRYRLPDGRTTYEIVVRRADGGAGAESSASIDGETASVENGAVRVPLRLDGGSHRVQVSLGTDVGARYAPHVDAVADRT